MTASVRHEFIREVNKSSRRLGCLTSSVEGGGGMHNLYNLSPGELFGATIWVVVMDCVTQLDSTQFNQSSKSS